MEYVEFLRVRRVFTIFALFVAVIMLLVIADIVFTWIQGGSISSFGLSTHDTSHRNHSNLFTYSATSRVPLSILLGIASYMAIVVATQFASSLNKENDGLDYVFVKPVRRELMAMRFIAIDIGGILAIFAFTFAAELVPLALLHAVDRIVIDARAIWICGLGLGVAFMWYGVLQAVTASYRGKGGTIVAFSWGIFVALAGLGYVSALGPIVLGVVHVLNFVNPIAYFSGIVSHVGTFDIDSVLGIPIVARVPIVWAIAFLSLAIAAISWKRVEA